LRVALVACPFCREVFPRPARSERGGECPLCGVKLVAFRSLPAAEGEPEDEAEAPEWEKLPIRYAGRGRGALAASAVLGLAAFVAPWIHMTMPDVVTFSGVDIARRLGWAWAAGVAWFVLFPIVVSRRSIMQMRGARVAVAFLATLPATTAVLLLARPPHGTRGVPLHFTFAWGLYATLALSVVAAVVAVTFGGRVDEIRVRRGSSSGQVVH
jgi:hypothetical protein